MTVLSRAEWTAREAAHHARVDSATAHHRARRQDGVKHPVEDFLFRYYSHSPAQLRRWHPGVGVRLEGGERPWKFYRFEDDYGFVDQADFVRSRGQSLQFIRRLLKATAQRAPHLGCFGMHEWAMVYRLSPEQVRHTDWPLRLSPAETDAVVESHRIGCSHFDAFRFFTDPARPLNTLAPTRDSQVEMEQPGCLHAGMDVYKWAYKLTPAVPSELLMDCFDLAREIRHLDMAAAPYDLRDLGLDPVRIETTDGKAEYVRRQRSFAERGQALRQRLLAVCDQLLDDAPISAARHQP
ncbi:hypothetical protein [Demetria terragena]|uniref:hypothetical protein n=1 Tax=Demetria terragena TaxID=63959 RepID=UPI00037064FA|nr:hypothetical protein [Demetria terragena]